MDTVQVSAGSKNRRGWGRTVEVIRKGGVRAKQSNLWEDFWPPPNNQKDSARALQTLNRQFFVSCREY